MMAGRIGNTITINGKPAAPLIARPNERIRLRLVNAANARIFGLDFGEPSGPRETGPYEALHRDVIAPMQGLFELLREITGAIQHEIGAFG